MRAVLGLLDVCVSWGLVSEGGELLASAEHVEEVLVVSDVAIICGDPFFFAAGTFTLRLRSRALGHILK